MGEAIIHFYFTDKKECISTVEDGLKLAEEYGVHVFDFQLISLAVLVSVSTGDFETAGRYRRRLEQMLGMVGPWDTSFYFQISCLEALEKGNVLLAQEYAKKALELCQNFGNPISESYTHLSNALVKCELEIYEEAIEHTETARGMMRNFKGPLMPCLFIESYIAFKQGKEDRGFQYLREAMTIGRELGYTNTMACQSSVMTELCLKALEAGIEVGYVQELIRKHNLVPDSPPLHIDNWPWAMKIYTMGRFSLVIDGKPLRFTAKAQKKPLEMLRALIAFGGREVSEFQLSDALWPETDTDTAHRSFATTLHRLRQLLGNEKIVQLKEGRVTLDNRYCWVDTWAYERILGKVEELWNRTRADEHIKQIEELTEKVTTMYKGDFLLGEEQPWPISLRERLKSKNIRYISRLGNYWEQSGECERALEWYMRALEADTLVEEFYQKIMTCYQRLGRKSEAIAVYNRCQKTLSSVFGIEPSPDTQRIYRGIME
jgi:DNA-binding SARP family transcriptional activator